MKAFGSQSMVDPLLRVMVRRPDVAFGSADPERWHYTSQPNLEIACQEHDDLVHTLRGAGVEVVYHDQPLPDHADAIFVRDPCLVTERGAVILSMGKELRRGEEAAIARSLEAAGVPTYCMLTGNACAEGGDLLWLDRRTLAVGLGFRTNAEGLRQLCEAMQDLCVTVIPVPLPYGEGPRCCLHLMSLISVLDHDLAVVRLPHLPVPFWQLLQDRGFRLLEVAEDEYATMGHNVLALAPRKVIMLRDNPVTRQRLEDAGCEVLTYKGDEISLKAEGGVTCLTRPIRRRA
jgi:N-dimethylarginine dimethylaminohydrolase